MVDEFAYLTTILFLNYLFYFSNLPHFPVTSQLSSLCILSYFVGKILTWEKFFVKTVAAGKLNYTQNRFFFFLQDFGNNLPEFNIHHMNMQKFHLEMPVNIPFGLLLQMMLSVSYWQIKNTPLNPSLANIIQPTQYVSIVQNIEYHIKLRISFFFFVVPNLSTIFVNVNVYICVCRFSKSFGCCG